MFDALLNGDIDLILRTMPVDNLRFAAWFVIKSGRLTLFGIRTDFGGCRGEDDEGIDVAKWIDQGVALGDICLMENMGGSWIGKLGGSGDGTDETMSGEGVGLG